MPSDNLLYDIERHCNNYFNPTNDPNSSERNYPESFLELVKKIDKFENEKVKTNFSSERFGNYSYTVDAENSSWQKTFFRELSIYKRAKFL